METLKVIRGIKKSPMGKRERDTQRELDKVCAAGRTWQSAGACQHPLDMASNRCGAFASVDDFHEQPKHISVSLKG